MIISKQRILGILTLLIGLCFLYSLKTGLIQRNLSVLSPALAKDELSLAWKLQEGEIALWGKLENVTLDNPGNQVYATAFVEGFGVPGGRGQRFGSPRYKTLGLTQAQVSATSPKTFQLANLQAGQRFFVVGIETHDGKPFKARLMGSMTDATFQTLYKKVFTQPVVVPVAPPVKATRPSPQTVARRNSTKRPPPAFIDPVPQLPAPLTARMTVEEMTPWMNTLQQTYPDEVQLSQIGVSSQGRAITAILFTPPNTSLAALNRVVVICRLHGDEPEATATGIELARQIATINTPAINRIRSRMALMIIPVANPDGASLKIRHNAAGQDLNRDWGRQYSLEVNSILGAILNYQPHLVIDVHQWVPGDRTQTPMVEYAGSSAMAKRMATLMRTSANAAGYRLGLHHSKAGGTLSHRYLAGLGIPAILLETVHQPNSIRRRKIAIGTGVTAIMSALYKLS